MQLDEEELFELEPSDGPIQSGLVLWCVHLPERLFAADPTQPIHEFGVQHLVQLTFHLREHGLLQFPNGPTAESFRRKLLRGAVHRLQRGIQALLPRRGELQFGMGEVDATVEGARLAEEDVLLTGLQR